MAATRGNRGGQRDEGAPPRGGWPGRGDARRFRNSAAAQRSRGNCALVLCLSHPLIPPPPPTGAFLCFVSDLQHSAALLRGLCLTAARYCLRASPCGFRPQRSVGVVSPPGEASVPPCLAVPVWNWPPLAALIRFWWPLLDGSSVPSDGVAVEGIVLPFRAFQFLVPGRWVSERRLVPTRWPLSKLCP